VTEQVASTNIFENVQVISWILQVSN